MNCYFCHQDLNYNHYNYYPNIVYCNNHPLSHENKIKYYFNSMEQLWRISFRTIIKDKIFEVCLYPHIPETMIREIYTHHDLHDMTEIETSKEILLTPSLLPITPENAITKLQSILTFQ
jgi:hypothetical protein